MANLAKSYKENQNIHNSDDKLHFAFQTLKRRLLKPHLNFKQFAHFNSANLTIKLNIYKTCTITEMKVGYLS